MAYHLKYVSKVKLTYVVYIALYYEKLISKALWYGMWHVLTRDHTILPATHTFFDKWNEPYTQSLLPSCVPLAGTHFAIPRRVEG